MGGTTAHTSRQVGHVAAGFFPFSATDGRVPQSQRLKVYDEHITMLLAIGKAYRCFCPPEDQPQQITRDMAESHQQSHQKHGRKSECLGTCREISDQESEDRALNGERFAVRFKTRRPPQEPIRWHDLVYGARESGKTLQPDIVIRKSDGFPSYHFANVVDDRLMGITHVIRGAVRIYLCRPRKADNEVTADLGGQRNGLTLQICTQKSTRLLTGNRHNLPMRVFSWT